MVSEKDCLNIFPKITLYVAPVTNQIKRFGQKSYKNSHISNETADIVNLHFSRNKSMGTISSHSNKRSSPTRIKTQFM